MSSSSCPVAVVSMPVPARLVPKLWRVMRFGSLESDVSENGIESPAAMVVSAGRLWMVNVVPVPSAPGRTRLTGRAPQPRADADKAQLAGVRVEGVLVVRVREHRLDHEGVARHGRDASEDDGQAVLW